jgi:hypothetical protein
LRARPALHRLGSLSEVLGLETDVKRIEPLGGWGRLIRLDPDVEEVEEDDVWRHDKWGVEWPFSVEELEETVRR